MRTTFRREYIGEMGLGKDQDILKTAEIDVLFHFSSLDSGRRADCMVSAMDCQKPIVVSVNPAPFRHHEKNYLPYRQLNIGVRSFLELLSFCIR